MGDVPVGKHILLSSKSLVFRVHTNYNSQGTSRLFSYFSNLSACQGYLQNSFSPFISYAISISRLSYFIVSFYFFLEDAAWEGLLSDFYYISGGAETVMASGSSR